MDINFCVTLTTIPSRLKNLRVTIDSINNQTLKPHKIFLNIPKEYKRFPNTYIKEKDLENIKKIENIEVIRCNDFGPSTKLMGSLDKIRKYDCVIIVDDDHEYHKLMCEIFIEEFKKKKTNYSFYLNKIFNIKMAQCADGFLIDTMYLDKISDFYNKFVKNNKNMFFDDDLWFAIYLQLIKKVKLVKILDIFQKRTGENVVYRNQHASDSLNKTIHGPHKLINRRKIQKIEYLKFMIKRLYVKI
tara:strand:+ start:209 stop:940 length:732 start_codon:yes stop_codon:yes gene_type:complete